MLNKQQKEIVSHSGSALLVIAGPGSGKTRVIVERIIHLVKAGIKPSEILCLTFSEKAAEEMKQRLDEVIDITEMDVSTFHSFSKDLLHDNVLFSGMSVSAVIPRSYQLVWGIKNIDDFKLEHISLGNNSVEVIEAIMDGISNFKDEIIFPEDLQKYVQSRIHKKLSEEEKDIIFRLSDLTKVYFKYREFKRKKALIDFDDMVFQAIRLLRKKPVIRRKYQHKYKHIFVDEFQDNNYAQLELLKLLTNNGNITVVGDDDQSIYKFQGAYLTNFQDFLQYFSNAKKIILNQNYRSPKNIVKLSSQLLDILPNRQPKKLDSKNVSGDKIIVAECENEQAEIKFVIQQIKKLLEKTLKNKKDKISRKIEYKDIVILARRKNDGRKFALALKSQGFPVNFVGESNIFTSTIMRDFMAYLKIIVEPSIAGISVNRLMKRHGLSEPNIALINQKAKRKAYADPTDVDFVLDTLVNCDKIGITQKTEAKELGDHILKIIDLSNKTTISDLVFKIIMKYSDLYKRTLVSNSSPNQHDRLILNELYKIALEFESLNVHGAVHDFLNYLLLLSNFDSEVNQVDDTENAIKVTTIHQSKGKEFPIVFIVDAATNKIPSRYRREKFIVPNELSKGIKRSEDERTLHIEEERRLFYVALTRVQNKLFICYAKRYGNNLKETKPSKFLQELNYQENPLIEVTQFKDEEKDLFLNEENKIEKIKKELQHHAIKAINNMNLKTAVQNIVDLHQVKYFEENNTLNNFDVKNILNIDKSNIHVEKYLQNENIPLFNSKKLKLSVSKLKTYKDCPLKFKFAHILNVPSQPQTFFDIGTAVHAVAEHLTKLQLDKIIPTEEMALEIFEKEWNSTRFESETEANQAKTKSIEMVKTCFNWLINNKNQPISAEQRFSITVGGIKFNGVIDRIEKDENDNIFVLDFKTGNVYETKNSIKEDIQLNLYALAIKEKYGILPKQASLFYLKENKFVSYNVNTRQVNKIKKEIEGKVANIINEQFEPIPKFDNCRRCDFLDICDSKEELINLI
ncbi:MAG: ATP-dependent helicase [Nitrososphaeraceae archaeon]